MAVSSPGQGTKCAAPVRGPAGGGLVPVPKGVPHAAPASELSSTQSVSRQLKRGQGERAPACSSGSATGRCEELRQLDQCLMQPARKRWSDALPLRTQGTPGPIWLLHAAGSFQEHGASMPQQSFPALLIRGDIVAVKSSSRSACLLGRLADRGRYGAIEGLISNLHRALRQLAGIFITQAAVMLATFDIDREAGQQLC